MNLTDACDSAYNNGYYSGVQNCIRIIDSLISHYSNLSEDELDELQFEGLDYVELLFNLKNSIEGELD